MKMFLRDRLIRLASVGLFIGLTAFCSSDLRDEVVSNENQEQLLEQARNTLTYDEVKLLEAFLERSQNETGVSQLPVGMTLRDIISGERALNSLEIPQESGEAVDRPSDAPGSTAKGLTPESGPSERRPAVDPAAERLQSKGSETASSNRPDTSFEPESGAEVTPAGSAEAEKVSPSTAVVPSGTSIQVRLAQSVSSKSSQSGDSFEAILDDPLIVDGNLVAQEGARLVGTLQEVVSSGKVKGKAQMSMALRTLYTEAGEYAIRCNVLRFEAEESKGSDAKKIGIATGVGAVIGAITGGKKGAVIGSVVGAGAGTGAVLMTPGEEVEFPSEQQFQFIFSEPAELKVLPQ